MFTDTEYDIIFNVFSNYETQTDDEYKVKQIMQLLQRQKEISDTANEQISAINEQINNIRKGGD